MKNKKTLVKTLFAMIAIFILFGLCLLTAYNSYVHLDQFLYETIQRIAVTISLCLVGVTFYEFDKNPFFALTLFLLGLINLISATIFFDTSIAFTYFAAAILVYSAIFKDKKRTTNP